MDKRKETGQSELVTAMIEYLGCPCRYFPPMADDGPIMEAYYEAWERGKKEGFVPVLVAEDKTLWECLIINTHENKAGNLTGRYEFVPEMVACYRKEMENAPLQPGEEVLAEYMEEREEEGLEVMDLNEELMEDMPEDEAMDSFMGYWDYSRKNTCPLILAEIPVNDPWRIFAWLPFGGWNECPGTLDLMAVAKHWFELYGAVPGVITHDVLEFAVPEPISEEQSAKVAAEQYTFCPDIVDQGMGSLGLLAKILSKSNIWYFWWD